MDISVINVINNKAVDNSSIRGYGFLYEPGLKRGKAIVVEEIIMDHMWPVGGNLAQIKEKSNLNPGGQLYAHIGWGDTPNSGFWVPVFLETQEESQKLTEVSDMFNVLTDLEE